MAGPGTQRRRGGLHIGRYTEIVSVLAAYGFGSILASLNIEKYIILTRKLLRSRGGAATRRMTQWERLRHALEDLGPTFIKLGQFMSNRPDILPGALIAELEKLQDSVAPFPANEAAAIFERELGRPVDEVFARFESEPCASASISQVHKAVLRSGDEVAVKIQRPRIVDRIAEDIGILGHLATLAERSYRPLQRLRPTQLVEEFRRMLDKELDFAVESSHIARFRKDFEHEPKIIAPAVYGSLSTRRVLVTEFVHGVGVLDLDQLRQMGHDTRDIARRGAEAMLKQIFDFGFFHADPHPGNILVQQDGTICFLDFGAVGILPPSLRYHLGLILYGVVTKDSQRIIKTLALLTHEPIRDMPALEYDLTEFIEEYSLAQLREVNVGDILRRFTRIIIDHELTIIPGFYVLLRAIVTTEGVGYRLDPDFNMVSYLEPYVKRLIRHAPRAPYLIYDAYFLALDVAGLLKDLPFETRELLRQARTGQLKVQFEHRGLESMVTAHTQLVNRLVFSIVLAALIIGSSVVVHSGLPPHFHGVPAFGIIGFALAALIGFGLLFAMLRRRRW
ncbi:MAG: phosphotransferase [Chitinivibrionales bacterium]|nr:phosphotransferase [Chitinivibrionales bacterium]